MSEVNLLAFGCVVTFTAVAGAYVYLRESFVAQQRRAERVARAPAVDRGAARKSA